MTTVSVDEALAKGRRMLINIPMILLFTPPVIATYLVIQKEYSGWLIMILFVLGLVLAYLYWAVMVTRWRLWAFENVRNVHELKKRAIKEKLIHEEGSFYEKTEIRTSSDKEKWQFLQSKFDQPDLFMDDYDVPAETTIYYSKSKNIGELIFMLALMGVGLYLALKTDSHLIGGGIAIFALVMAFKEFREATNNEPQIILNDKGIQTIKTEFKTWSEISDEEVIAERSGKNETYHLVYYYDNYERAELLIDDYNTSQRDLEKLMRIYRGRYEKKMN